jgi:hypothetical protein
VDQDARNQLAAAAASYEEALAALRTAGPPAALDEAQLPRRVCELRPDQMLVARGLALKRLGNAAGAEACCLAALDPSQTSGWPQLAEPGKLTPALLACSTLVVLYEKRGDRVKRDARMRAWRELLNQAGVAVPSDTEAWLDYELVRLGDTDRQLIYRDPEAFELLRRAERVYGAGALELGQFLRFCSRFLVKDAAVAMLERALALAREPDGKLARTEALRTLTLLGRKHLSLGPGDTSGFSTPAAKTASLRAYEEAAAMYTGLNARTVEYADLLDSIVQVSNDPVAQGIPEIRVQLAGGRLVSLHEPNGQGRIALGEEAVRIRTEVLGQQSPALVPHLMSLGMLLNHHCDVMEAAAVMARAATLAAATLGESHPTTRSARQQAASAQTNLKMVLSRVRPPGLQLTRRMAQDAQLRLFENGGLKIYPPGYEPGPEDAVKDKRRAEATVARAQRASDDLQCHNPPCAGCGAVRGADAPHFQYCAACKLVAYCTAECQRAHWKRAHKQECATLKGAAPAS